MDTLVRPFPPVVLSLGEKINESVTVDEPGNLGRRFDVMDWLSSCPPDECTISIPVVISNTGDTEAAFIWDADIGVLTEHESPGLDEVTICVVELDDGCES